VETYPFLKIFTTFSQLCSEDVRHVVFQLKKTVGQTWSQSFLSVLQQLFCCFATGIRMVLESDGVPT